MYNLHVVKDDNKHPGTIYIALSGKKQVGKDTAIEMISKRLHDSGKTFKITAFAEVLKEATISVLGLKRNLVYGSNEDKETRTHIMWDNFPLSIRLKNRNNWYMPIRSGQMTIREVLQIMGTDIFRVMFDNNVWAVSPFNRDWGDTDVVLITDCRFINEKTITEEHNGVIIRLERDTGFVDEHASETSLDNETFKFLYKNNGSYEDLENFIYNTLQELQLL